MLPQKKLLLIVSGLVLGLISIFWIGWSTRPLPVASRPSCRLTFLDVGQGDAILIQTPDHQDMLIDGGPSTRVSAQLGKYLGIGNSEIELAVLTHPDADHLTGLLAVVDEWPVKTILTTGVIAETKLFKRWQSTIADRPTASTIYVQSGDTFQLGKYLTVNILWPDRDWKGITYSAKATNGRGGINDTSIGTKITCAGSTALFLGDASDAVEDKLLSGDKDLHVDLLKVSHHGSKYSSRADFLQALHPDLAVIPVGAENRYGHPHPTVLERLKVAQIPVYRTDLSGTLFFRGSAEGWQLTP